MPRALLLIADISGYTRFISSHRFSLAHAQDAVARLLEAIIDSAKPFQLAKLEGDAAFLYAEGAGGAPLLESVKSIRRAFAARRRKLTERSALCSCSACTQVGSLQLKFVAHEGEIAYQRVKRFTELAGLDVILVHRMLKNEVPISEYVLVTDVLKQTLPGGSSTPLTHDFEGIGPTQTHYAPLEALAPVRLGEPPPAGWVGRLLEKAALELRSVPYLLGWRKACETFRNVTIEDEGH